MTAKISVSLPDSDLATLDALIAEGLATGRSDAIQLAIARVRESVVEARLAEQLLATFDEPETQQLMEDWDAVVGDGL